MDTTTPYNGAITREQFLMRETRAVARLKAEVRTASVISARYLNS